MQKDRRGHIFKIAELIWHDVSDKVIDYILQKTTVKTMHDEISIATNLEISVSQGLALVHKGQVGEWVNHFSQEQSALVEQNVKSTLSPWV